MDIRLVPEGTLDHANTAGWEWAGRHGTVMKCDTLAVAALVIEVVGALELGRAGTDRPPAALVAPPAVERLRARWHPEDLCVFVGLALRVGGPPMHSSASRLHGLPEGSAAGILFFFPDEAAVWAARAWVDATMRMKHRDDCAEQGHEEA